MSVKTGRHYPRELSADGSAPYRYDIDGLRALAIMLVVVYHVWLGRVSGGVDVFLMISAFFLTASFARRMQHGARLKVPGYWLRKFRRLLPAAAVTIVGVLAAVFLAFPQTTWPAMWRQAVASLFYVQNWELAASNVDYYARETEVPSPFQHFWSLSVQGQVFIIWPLIFLVVALLLRRTSLRATPVLTVIFGLIFIVSLAFSIWETQTAQSFAYFDTRTRLWEFAAGSLVALALPLIRLPNIARAILGWAGVIGIVICGLVLDVQGGFPGYLALWPVLCTAMVILGGSAPAPFSPTAILASRPLRFLGRDAYALYLVHWPVLITYLTVREQTRVGVWAGLALILISMLIARVISWGVENPLRHLKGVDHRPLISLGVVVASLALVLGPLFAWQSVEQRRIENLASADPSTYTGAANTGGETPTTARELPLRPDATLLDQEWVTLDGPCTGERAPVVGSALDETCNELVPREPSAKTVLVVGDSHAQQWTSTILPIAEAENWTVITLLKGGCSFAFDEPWFESAERCAEWRVAAVDYIAAMNPSIVFGMATKSVSDSPEEYVLPGMPATIAAVQDADTQVVLFRDNPRFADDMYECALEPPDDRDSCTRDRAQVLAEEDPATPLRDLATIIDLSDALCPEGRCEPVIGNIAVYIDDNHLTSMFGKTLAPFVRERLVDDQLLSATRTQ